MNTTQVLYENNLYSFFRLSETAKDMQRDDKDMARGLLGFAPKLPPDLARKRLGNILGKKGSTPMSSAPSNTPKRSSVFLPPLRIDRGRGGAYLVFDAGKEELLLDMVAELREKETLFLNVAAAVCRTLGEAHRTEIHNLLMLPAFVTYRRSRQEAHLIYTGYSYDPSEPTEVPYIPPECTGRISFEPDHRQDLFSLGMLLAVLRYGNPEDIEPSGRKADYLQRVYSNLTSRGIPCEGPIDAVIGKLLRVHPDERYRDLGGLEKDFEACLKIHIEGLSTEGFVPGDYDSPEYLEIPTTLRGREMELSVLSDNADTARRGGCSITFITGYSGSGKTALVEEFINKSMREGTLFLLLRNKCDQVINTPFSSVKNAFEDLALYFLGRPEEELKKHSRRLAEIVGPHSGMICELIPPWKNLLPKVEKTTIAAGPLERQNIIRQILTEILKVSADFRNPTIFFIDDMQWIDPASLQLIMDIAENPGMRFLLFIGAYRSNEVGDDHPLSRRLEELAGKGVAHSFVHIGPLELPNIEEIVGDTLGCSVNEGKLLARLLLDKSGGNPFFLRVLFSSFYSDGLIEKGPDGRWSWNSEKIGRASYGDEAAEVLVHRIEMQPKKLKELLKSAAYLGHTFSIGELSVIHGQNPPVETEAICKKAEASGFIAKTEHNDRYSFNHDKIQRVFYLLEPQPDLFHYRIALALRGHPDIAGPFTLAYHYRISKAYIDSEEKKAYVSNLFREAGKKALELTAWKDGYSYFTNALEFAPVSIWERDYNDALELYNLLCEGAFLSGEYSDFDGYFEEIAHRAGSVLDTFTSKQLSLRVRMAENRMQEAFQTLLSYLPSLGIPDPRLFSASRLKREILREMRRLMNISAEEVLSLPHSTDRWENARAELLVSAFSTVYISASEYVPFFAWQMVRAVERTGFTAISPFCLLCFTFPLIGLGHYKEAYHIGGLGETLVNEGENHPFGSKVHTWFAGFLISWNAPIEGMLDGCREGGSRR